MAEPTTKKPNPSTTIIDHLAKILATFAKTLIKDIRVIVREEIEYALSKGISQAQSSPSRLKESQEHIVFDGDYDDDEELSYKGKSAEEIRREINASRNPQRGNGMMNESIRINPNDMFADASIGGDNDSMREVPVPRNPEIEKRIVRDYSDLI
jgi:hypothetical protein